MTQISTPEYQDNHSESVGNIIDDSGYVCALAKLAKIYTWNTGLNNPSSINQSLYQVRCD